ncbi:MAG: hypothetical protein HC844_21180 [Tabrizicola sp.]|nr:hypothetical protein [Tabrizicola sp.]
MALIGIVAPIVGTWGLVAFGAQVTFAAVGAVQALAVAPLLGAPHVTIKESAPGAFRAALPAAAIFAAIVWIHNRLGYWPLG